MNTTTLKTNGFHIDANDVMTICVSTRNKEEQAQALLLKNEENSKATTTSAAFDIVRASTTHRFMFPVATEFNNGTGYFDPLTDAVFVDEEGEKLPPNSTIEMNQLEGASIARRLVIIVVSPGNNVIIHDRYRIINVEDQQHVFVCTSDRDSSEFRNTYNIFRTTRAWGNDICNRTRLADLFGLEINGADGSVYVPFSRPEFSFEF